MNHKGRKKQLFFHNRDPCVLLVLTLARVILHRLSFLDKDAASIFIESTFCISAAPSRSEVCKLTQEFAVLLIHHVHLSHLESRVVYIGRFPRSHLAHRM